MEPGFDGRDGSHLVVLSFCLFCFGRWGGSNDRLSWLIVQGPSIAWYGKARRQAGAFHSASEIWERERVLCTALSGIDLRNLYVNSDISSNILAHVIAGHLAQFDPAPSPFDDGA